MIIGRLLAYMFLCLTFLILGAEGLRLLETGDSQWITVAQLVDLNPFKEAAEIEQAAEKDMVEDNWENILDSLLGFSAFFASLILSCLLFFLSRSRFR